MTALAGCGKGDKATGPGPAPEVRVVEVQKQDVPLYREWVGEVLGAEDIEVRARVEGWLEGIHFREGTMVRKGQLLYTIDPSELKERVAAAEANLASAQTLLARAQSDVARYRPLAAAGAVSQRDLEAAEAEAGARQGSVDAARASLNQARIDLGYATVTAPIDGLIGISAARVGDFVGRPPNAIILNTVSNITSVRVRFSITEQEYLEVARRTPDQKVAQQPGGATLQLVLADGSTYPHPGRVNLAERQIDPTTGTLQVEANFPNPERLLRPGQFGRVRAVFAERKEATVVPSRAVTDLQGRKVVWVVAPDNKVQFRVLTPGPQAGDVLVVESGVNPGEKVVVEGMQRMRADLVVKPTTVPFRADSTAATPGGATPGAPAGH